MNVFEDLNKKNDKKVTRIYTVPKYMKKNFMKLYLSLSCYKKICYQSILENSKKDLETKKIQIKL